MPEKIKDIRITKDNLEEGRVESLLRQYETGIISRAEYYRKLKGYRI